MDCGFSCLDVVVAALLIGIVISAVILVIKNVVGALIPPSFCEITTRQCFMSVVFLCLSTTDSGEMYNLQKWNQFVNELTRRCNKHLYSVIFSSFQLLLRARVASAISTNYFMTIIWLLGIQGKRHNLIRKHCILGGEMWIIFYLLL